MKSNMLTNSKNWRSRFGWRPALFVMIALFGLLSALYSSGAILVHDSSLVDIMALCPNEDTAFEEIKLTGAQKRTLFIPTVDHSQMEAWYFAVPKATKLAIINHGNSGNLSQEGFNAETFAKKGISVLVYDYRGFGHNRGRATLHGILDDGLTVFNFANEKLGFSANKIIEFGESIGTTVACFVGSQKACAAVMLQSPLDTLPSAAKWLFPVLSIYPDPCFAEPHLDNARYVTKIHAPIFICHGKVDAKLRAGGSQILFNNANQPKTLVYLPNCGHTDVGIEDSELYLKSFAKFITALN